MGARWICIKVELVSGRGRVLDPAPGRIMAIPPRTTFEGLAEAIDTAFGRWDVNHLCQFEFPDGTVVTDPESAAELESSEFGPLSPTLHLSKTVARHLTKGVRFTYTFDLGDNWEHRCTVLPTIDPWEAVGGLAAQPVPIWGWGDLPDQYGRRTEDGHGTEDAEPGTAWSDTTPAPEADRPPAPWVDLRAVRAAKDAAGLRPALLGVEFDHALHQVGQALARLWDAGPADHSALEPLLLSVVNRATLRAWPGDDLLHAQLLARLRSEEPARVPVDPGELADLGSDEYGAVVDPATGDVWPDFPDGLDGLDDTFDPAEGVHYRDDTGGQFEDMEVFVETQPEQSVRDRLRKALDGPRPFARFKDAVSDLDLWPQWQGLRDDRRIGRARAFIQEAVEEGTL